MLPLLYDKHDRVASLAAQFFYEVSPNAEVKVAMRLSDALRPLIALLSSPVADTRLVDDRQALIDELKKEREDAARAAVEAAQEAEAEAWLAARRDNATEE